MAGDTNPDREPELSGLAIFLDFGGDYRAREQQQPGQPPDADSPGDSPPLLTAPHRPPFNLLLQ